MTKDRTEAIRQMQQGNPGSFRPLYDAMVEEAMTVALAVLRDRESAKEVLQETFIRVYTHWDRYDPRRDFEPWFFRILLHECRRYQRKSQRWPIPVEELQLASPEEDIPSEVSPLEGMVEALPPEDRILLQLKYVQGFSERELATMLDMHPGKVKTKLYRLRTKLRQELESRKEDSR
ncbi:RNA polymerase sigma factor [Proteiniclasticum sp. BAD-10]|uniref:RNA polymerase sigma factor n=1 Tax=Proteiniclasticum sediminis TaxID=2804028 RepID=A0A941HPM9_9CLOT|nr:RNA polymerase sigma factor [Proteiniclasticum sediminis]MBR0575504.1 RNA polymerase sigma factor [Proteiniclasticum sediminis]